MLLRLRVSLSLLLLLLLSCGTRGQEQASKSETPPLQIETLVASPEGCTERSATGDTVAIHYTGILEDGRIIDTSLSRDPLQVELGKRQVIPEDFQQKLTTVVICGIVFRTGSAEYVCWGETKSHYPSTPGIWQARFSPTIPADAVLQFEVELIQLSRANYWQKLSNDILPLLSIGLVPALLGLIGYYLYKKAQMPRISKKKLKEEKKNKIKKK